jgi:hypothetical protein
MEARPGAFWDWMNGDVDLDRLTFELEEMKAKGMSGAEIWDIGVIRPHPEEKGPTFLGPVTLNLEGKIKNGKSGYFTTDYTDFDGFHGEDHCFLTNYPLTQRISDSIFITL